MTKRIEDFKITANRLINKDIFILELVAEGQLPEIRPGQFVEVRVDGSPDTFLRRPLSIHDADFEQNTIKLLVQLAGKGTETLSKLHQGHKLNLIYPLGSSFTLPLSSEKILLIGGGCGVAPLLFLGKYLKSKGYTPEILLGFRNRERIIEIEEYSSIGPVSITTEDGSVGEKGFVTGHSILQSMEFDRIYCCGPEKMMKAVAGYAAERNIQCEISLENLMACGFGACLCCVVETVNGNLCTCIDGPVFNTNKLKWQTLASK